MARDQLYDFSVRLYRDRETGQTIAEVLALEVAEYGADTRAAFSRLKAMVSFHVECLVSEGKPVPRERGVKEGLYLRIKPPAHAA